MADETSIDILGRIIKRFRSRGSRKEDREMICLEEIHKKNDRTGIGLWQPLARSVSIRSAVSGEQSS